MKHAIHAQNAQDSQDSQKLVRVELMKETAPEDVVVDRQNCDHVHQREEGVEVTQPGDIGDGAC